MKTIYVKPADVERKWYLIDAEGKAPGRIAAKAASILRGKEKALYAPLWELGDYLVIINAEKAAITGAKESDKMYYRHSGFPGGLKSMTYEKLLARHPSSPILLAIKGMLPKNSLGRKMLKNVKVYAGAEHPHAAQEPEKIEI